MNPDNQEFLEFVNIVENAINNNVDRLRKRYIRDNENPFEYYSDDEFERRYRFSKRVVLDNILPLVQERLEKPNNRGLPILPINQILIALRFYATGNFQVVCGDLRSVSQQSVSLIIKRVSEILAEHVRIFVKFPEDQTANNNQFATIAGFPQVSGCIDGTHIPIGNPGGDNAEAFRNRKGYFSLNVQR